MENIVFYHHNCPDGFSAAWVLWKKFKNKAEYRWLDYHAPFNYDFHNKTIYFVDVVPDEPNLERLAQNNRIIIIDHHISSQHLLPLANDYSFSLDHCAAVLTWHYLFPRKKMPNLLKYIEDVDLWKFRQPSSKYVNAAIQLKEFEFKEWSKVAKDLEEVSSRKKYVSEGKLIIKYQDKMINKIVSRAKPVMLDGQEGLAVNSSVLVSEIGNALLENRCSLAIIWFATKNKIKVSLRSKGDVDVAKIGEKYGGGGHQKASGFVLGYGDSLPWKDL